MGSTIQNNYSNGNSGSGHGNQLTAGMGSSGLTDFGSFSEKKEDGMKICRGPFNVNCTTSKDPQLVLLEMVKSLEIQKVSYKKVGNYGLRC